MRVGWQNIIRIQNSRGKDEGVSFFWRVGTIVIALAEYGGVALAQKSPITLSSIDPNNPYVSQQDMWRQPAIDPWATTTVLWQTADWRVVNALDISSWFGPDQEYLDNEQISSKS